MAVDKMLSLIWTSLTNGWRHSSVSYTVSDWNSISQCYIGKIGVMIYSIWCLTLKSVKCLKHKNVTRPLMHLCVAGSSLPQFPAAGPFTQLIYKNITVPVYTTLKGVSNTFYAFSHMLYFSSSDANMRHTESLLLCVAWHQLSSVLFLLCVL